MRGLGALSVLIGGCNAVFDIRETELVDAEAALSPRTLVFDNSRSTMDLVDFPVPIRLDASRVVYADVVDPGTNLRFEADGVDLPFEIEHWDPGGESVVWVRVPKITAGSRSDRVLMHYGVHAGGSERTADVWSEFDYVMHGEGDFNASVGAFPAMVGGDVTRVPGQIGGAVRFGGLAADRIVYANSIALLDAWPQYTVDFWIYCDYDSAALGKNPLGNDYEPRFFDKGGALTLGRLLQSGNPYFFKLQIDSHYQPTTLVTRQTLVPRRYWIHVVQTYDGMTQWIYRNGIISDYTVLGTAAPVAAGTSSLVLGGNQALSVRGMLDEVRISRQARSPDWIEAQYRAMTGGFVMSFLPGEVP